MYKEEWEKLPKFRCAKLIQTYPRRLEAVISVKGASTKYWLVGVNDPTVSFAKSRRVIAGTLNKFQIAAWIMSRKCSGCNFEKKPIVPLYNADTDSWDYFNLAVKMAV